RSLTALPLSVLIAHPSIRSFSHRRPLLVTPRSTRGRRRAEEDCTLSAPMSTSGLQSGLISHCSRKAEEQEEFGTRVSEIGVWDGDEERFRRLREAYFNSPEYDRSERPTVEEQSKDEGKKEEEEGYNEERKSSPATKSPRPISLATKQPKERKSI
ncbi:hypothetical protein PFISCL1PPCAC_26859, partial [Pristionchus fissidentatus]